MTDYDNCYLGPCWENLQRADGSVTLARLHAYRLNREVRFARTEEEALTIVSAARGSRG